MYIATCISYQKIRDIIRERNGMVVDIAGLTLISIKDTASCCISELIKTAYKNRNSSSIYMNTINQFTNATLKDLHTCSLTKFNNKKLAFMNSHNVYIWSD